VKNREYTPNPCPFQGSPFVFEAEPQDLNPALLQVAEDRVQSGAQAAGEKSHALCAGEKPYF